MNNISPYLNPAANTEVASANCVLRKSEPPTNTPISAIYSTEETQGCYYEVTLRQRGGGKAIFHVVSTATSRTFEGRVSYSGVGGGGVVYDARTYRFGGVEVGIGASGNVVVTFRFNRTDQPQAEPYTFTASFQPA